MVAQPIVAFNWIKSNEIKYKNLVVAQPIVAFNWIKSTEVNKILRYNNIITCSHKYKIKML